MERQQQDIASEIDKLKVNHMERLEKLEEERITEVNQLQQQIELWWRTEKKSRGIYNFKPTNWRWWPRNIGVAKKREKDEEAFHEMVLKWLHYTYKLTGAKNYKQKWMKCRRLRKCVSKSTWAWRSRIRFAGHAADAREATRWARRSLQQKKGPFRFKIKTQYSWKL